MSWLGFWVLYGLAESEELFSVKGYSDCLTGEFVGGCAKGTGEQKKEHVGYKVQVAETVTETVLAAGEPTDNFISGIVTHAARESDEEGALKMEREQQALGLDKPPVQYVDAAYFSTQALREAEAEGRELIGPAPGPGGNNAGRFGSDRFDVRVEERQAVCSAGQSMQPSGGASHRQSLVSF